MRAEQVKDERPGHHSSHTGCESARGGITRQPVSPCKDTADDGERDGPAAQLSQRMGAEEHQALTNQLPAQWPKVAKPGIELVRE